jgi:2'-5' RNA ligase
LFYRVEEGKDELTRLAAAVETGLSESLGIPKEKRPFRAHATIARIKKSLPRAVTDKLEQAEPLSGAAQTVTSVDLMQSELRPGGAVYTRVKEFALPQLS